MTDPQSLAYTVQVRFRDTHLTTMVMGSARMGGCLIASLVALALLLPSVGMAETLTTNDGRVYVGKVVIQDADRIVLRTEEGLLVISRKDVVDIAGDALNAKGLLWQGSQAMAKAANAYSAKELGIAHHCYGLALTALTSIGSEAEEESALAKKMIEEIKTRVEELQAELDEQGLVVYEQQVFSKRVLEYHLREGHVLVGKSEWILPSQKCERCNGERSICCPVCSGNGYLFEMCPKCDNGSVECPLCGGTGTKICNICKGRGGFVRRCPKCAGHGSYECPACAGRGWLPTGTFTRSRVRCSRCAGSGRLRCETCGGTGEQRSPCLACGGKGHLRCPKRVTCPECKGKGQVLNRCGACSGSGSIPCPICLGRGYTGKPCPDPNSPSDEEANPQADAETPVQQQE